MQAAVVMTVVCPRRSRIRSRARLPGWQRASTENTGSIRGRRNAVSRDAPPATWSLISLDRLLAFDRSEGEDGDFRRTIQTNGHIHRPDATAHENTRALATARPGNHRKFAR